MVLIILVWTNVGPSTKSLKLEKSRDGARCVQFNIQKWTLCNSINRRINLCCWYVATSSKRWIFFFFNLIRKKSNSPDSYFAPRKKLLYVFNIIKELAVPLLDRRRGLSIFGLVNSASRLTSSLLTLFFTNCESSVPYRAGLLFRMQKKCRV